MGALISPSLLFGPATISLVVAIATLALVFQWQRRFALVQSLLSLPVGLVVVSMSVKTVLNAQMLMCHGSGAKVRFPPIADVGASGDTSVTIRSA